jgi:hypothetical protein
VLRVRGGRLLNKKYDGITAIPVHTDITSPILVTEGKHISEHVKILENFSFP